MVGGLKKQLPQMVDFHFMAASSWNNMTFLHDLKQFKTKYQALDGRVPIKTK